MNILIPIVAPNSKMDEDNPYIKSLYEIQNKTILEYVHESLKSIEFANFIFVIRREDVTRFHLDNVIKLLVPNAKVIVAEGNTKGSACSCLLAIEYIDSDEPLIIAGSDQIIIEDINKVIKHFTGKGFDGGAVVFQDIHPRWSYVKLDNNKMVVEAAEKRPISKNACTGMYYYKTGKLFIEAAQEMILKRADVNDQYYVSPTFNEMILKHKKIGIYEISKQNYFSLANLKGIEAYEKYLIRSDI